MRKIIHIDMDAFYASVEQRDFPEYRGKPVAVGGEGRRGVVAAASYEARKYGVRSAMAGAIARKKCPHLIFARPRFDVYKSVSNQIMEIFREYTDLVEPMSLDEAYLDVTVNKKGIPSATIIAREIREKIKEQTQLTASAGVSFNKFLAKVGSDFNKPDGMTVIPPEKADEFIDALEIRKIPGVGKVTEQKLKDIGIFTGADMKKLSRLDLMRHFGKTGDYFYRLIRCEYNSPVVPERIAKSIGAERTFGEDITDEKEMILALEKITGILIKRISKKDARGKTVTLKIKYHDFEQHTRSKTLGFYVNPETELFSIVKELFYTPIVPVKPVRLLGVQISNLNLNEEETDDGQLTLEF